MDPVTAAFNACAAIAKLISDLVVYQTLVLERADSGTAASLADIHLKERERLLSIGDPFFNWIKNVKPPV